MIPMPNWPRDERGRYIFHIVTGDEFAAISRGAAPRPENWNPIIVPASQKALFLQGAVSSTAIDATSSEREK